MTQARNLKKKSARFRKRPLPRRENIRSAPRGRRFLAGEGCIRRAFRRRGAAWGTLLSDSKAVEDQKRTERAAWWRDQVRQTSLPSCTFFLHPRRAHR